MRDLNLSELDLVAGGTGESGDPIADFLYDETDPCPTGKGKSKNNNGYGNGAESGPPPGHSGGHNPQLLEDNLGPRGVR